MSNDFDSVIEAFLALQGEDLSLATCQGRRGRKSACLPGSGRKAQGQFIGPAVPGRTCKEGDELLVATCDEEFVRALPEIGSAEVTCEVTETAPESRSNKASAKKCAGKANKGRGVACANPPPRVSDARVTDPGVCGDIRREVPAELTAKRAAMAEARTKQGLTPMPLQSEVRLAVARCKAFVDGCDSRTRYNRRPMLAYRSFLKETPGRKPTPIQKWWVTEAVKGHCFIDSLAEMHFGETAPAWFSIENQLPKEQAEWDETKWFRPGVPERALLGLISPDFVPVGGKHLWRKGVIWDLLCATFDNVIDLRAYSKSLTSTLLKPLSKVTVRLTTIKTVGGAAAGCDGSGRFHPSCFPELNFQFRAMHIPSDFGVADDAIPFFMKGAMVADERCVGPNGEPEIWVDWLQVKGKKKGWAKAMAKADAQVVVEDVYLGHLKSWADDEDIRLGYQQLQFIHQNARTRALVGELITENMVKAFRKGPSTLISALAEEDDNIGLIDGLCRKLGLKTESVPMVAEALEARLKRQLYFMATGLGVKGHQLVVFIDNGVTPGHVVAGGYDKGQEVVMYRFPTLLAQGVEVYKVQKPLDHMLVAGKLPAGVCFMHADDLVDRHQGDDDGDFMSLVTDPRVVEMVRDHRYGRNEPVYLIEAEAQSNYFAASNSVEGERVGALPVIGEVGPMSLNQARFMAYGDYKSTVILAHAVQEAVDKPKKKMLRLDPYLAENPDMWVPVEGKPGRVVCKAARYPEEDVHWTSYKPEKWKKGRSFGYFEAVQEFRKSRAPAPNAIAWRSEDKAIDFRDWGYITPISTLKGQLPLSLVSYAYNVARKVWFEKQLVNQGGNITLNELFAGRDSELLAPSKAGVLHKALGLPVPKPIPYIVDGRNGTGYQAMRGKLGLRAFSDAFKRLNSVEPAARKNLLQLALEKLWETAGKLSVEELMAGFFHEIDLSGDNGGNVNNAFRLVCWPGSPVMEKLEVKSQVCDYLTPKIIDRLMIEAMKSDKPAVRLVEILLGSTHHLGEKGIPGWQCNCCRETLEAKLVLRLRDESPSAKWTLGSEEELRVVADEANAKR